jgi:hypothetical protein
MTLKRRKHANRIGEKMIDAITAMHCLQTIIS